MNRASKGICAVVTGIVALAAATALADGKSGGKVVTVAFGPGLNTAPLSGPSGPENHHIVPSRIEINVGDVINFVVAGTHQIRIYQSGVRLADVVNLLPPECRVNPPAASCAAAGVFPVILLDSPIDADTAPDLPTYYEGLERVPAPIPVTVNPVTGASQVVLPPRLAVQNRLETVSFSEPGRYLVICTILPHFNDKMIAWVEVKRTGGGHDRD